MVKGSIEWFYYNANTEENANMKVQLDALRRDFIFRFSPDCLEQMNGRELLRNVFNNDNRSMMHLLMYDREYRHFGASSEYSYMSIIYKGADGYWTLFEKNKHYKMNQEEAERKAEVIRDCIVQGARIIEKSELNSVADYRQLEKKLAVIMPFYYYVTILKYYQMLFPQFFPGMYADETLTRTIQILGLKNMGHKKRLLNAGIISIFIRNCKIDNIIFNVVYAREWGWIGEREQCLAAEDNFGKQWC